MSVVLHPIRVRQKMKKTKNLKIKKETIANLSKEQMSEVHGASFVYHTCICEETASCTLFQNCCPPPKVNAAKMEDYIG